jgi:DNA transformation protein
MSVSPGFTDFVVEQLAGCGPIATKRMFGGIGIYSGDIFFAIIDDDVLYLRVGDSNRKDFERAKAEPFRPYGDDRASITYYALPVSVLENADDLAKWGKKSIAVALQARDQKRSRKGR